MTKTKEASEKPITENKNACSLGRSLPYFSVFQSFRPLLEGALAIAFTSTKRYTWLGWLPLVLVISALTLTSLFGSSRPRPSHTRSDIVDLVALFSQLSVMWACCRTKVARVRQVRKMSTMLAL
eukprot:scaffold6649_cov147-Skeletonema_dohrnii-CCMP3373.AAC.3